MYVMYVVYVYRDGMGSVYRLPGFGIFLAPAKAEKCARIDLTGGQYVVICIT